MKKIIFLFLIVLGGLVSCGPFSDFNLEVVCINSRFYYYNHGYNAGGIAPAYDEEDKLIKCFSGKKYMVIEEEK
jgi:hypothetical protein